MKNTALIGLSVILSLSLTSCDNVQNENNGQVKDSDQVESSVSYTDILYDPLATKLVGYDNKTNRANILDTTDNLYQYPVAHSDNLYIAGNSIANRYKLIKVEGNQIKTVQSFKEGEGVFPIALIDDTFYFIHTYYNQDGSEKESDRHIATYNMNTKETLDFKQTTGLIVHGVIDEDYVFYTTYERATHKYHLNKIKRLNSESNTPELIKTDLIRRNLYVNDDGVCTTDHDHILCEHQMWENKLYNLFKNSKLIQASANTETGLRLKVTDIETNKVDFELDNIKGFKFEDDEIVIGSMSGLKKYKL